VQLDVRGRVDDAHAAGAEHRLDAIAPGEELFVIDVEHVVIGRRRSVPGAWQLPHAALHGRAVLRTPLPVLFPAVRR